MKKSPKKIKKEIKDWWGCFSKRGALLEVVKHKKWACYYKAGVNFAQIKITYYTNGK